MSGPVRRTGLLRPWRRARSAVGLAWPGGLGRVVVVVGLAGVAAVGLRSRAYSVASQGVPAGVGRWASTGVVAVLVVAGAVLLGVFLFSLRRARDDEGEWVPERPRVSRWSRLVALLVVLVVLGAPVAVLVVRLRHGAGVSELAGGLPGIGVRPAVGSPVPSAGPGGHVGATVPVWPWIVLGCAVAVLLAVAFLRRTRLSGLPAAGTAPGPPVLAGAVDAGLAELRGRDDPRAAVLACYAAMEHALAATSAEPRRTDTPAEVVGRASAAGLVDGSAAATLAALFRRARYSTLPFGPPDRDRAESALERIRADLEVHA